VDNAVLILYSILYISIVLVMQEYMNHEFSLPALVVGWMAGSLISLKIKDRTEENNNGES